MYRNSDTKSCHEEGPNDYKTMGKKHKEEGPYDYSNIAVSTEMLKKQMCVKCNFMLAAINK